jgi:sigma-54 dependent transcriptional regulator, acetoin dehydrogenase operon transcriptional activator AcoR
VIEGGAAGPEVRAEIRESWDRSRLSGVRPQIKRAPTALDENGLAAARESVDWLAVVADITRQLPPDFESQKHLLGIFDAAGRMLRSEGDPWAQETMAEINLAPGGLWLESAAGTNGVGTALAAGHVVDIVGTEHYCEAWQHLHCATAPIHDPSSGEILGALDLSGPAELASPLIIDLVLALSVAADRALAARDLQRRYAILNAFSECSSRYPGEVIIAADRTGRVLHASPATPPEFLPGRETSASARFALATLIEEAADQLPRSAGGLLAYDGSAAVVYPVFDGTSRIGGCLLLRRCPQMHSIGKAPPRRSTRYSFLDFLGQSPALAEARRIAGAAAANTLPVLILGESGVGKELFAQAIHGASERRDRPFVAVNCGALPGELIESELFGYVGGAFSGARREGCPGKFEAADEGTIFLDEIGELPLAAQTALLRVLQEGEITRVGCSQAKPVDVRVIAATNRDLRAALADGSLRRDLYYRLNVLALELPPLRERQEDIPVLARRFLETSSTAMRKRGLTFDAEVVTALQGYVWPGNVRELQNVVARLVALASSSHITLADLPATIGANPPSRAPLPAPDSPRQPHRSRRSVSELDVAEERAELLALIKSAHTMGEAAARLGITRSTLYRRLERLGVQPRRILAAL